MAAYDFRAKNNSKETDNRKNNQDEVAKTLARSIGGKTQLSHGLPGSFLSTDFLSGTSGQVIVTAEYKKCYGKKH